MSKVCYFHKPALTSGTSDKTIPTSGTSGAHAPEVLF